MRDNKKILNLELTAARCRQNVMRMIKAAHHGHVGGALSALDIATALYFEVMNIDPANPGDPDRDRFLLSAGHKCLCQYAVLAERGFFSKDILDTYGDLKAKIPGHPDMHKLPGVEANTGALGHGMSIACGMAMAAKLDGRPYSVYAITGDGELPEGSNWEAAAAAAKFGLDNLVVFVDNNNLQISGRASDVMNMDSIIGKFQSFGWATRDIDGNDMEEILGCLRRKPEEIGKPLMVRARTIKAKGLSFGEDKAEFHFWNADDEGIKAAIKETDEKVKELEQALAGL